MYRMFHNAVAFNQPIGNWDTSSVSQMYDICSMMLLRSVRISVHGILLMSPTWVSMFADAIAFNKAIGSWNISNVTNMGGMFWA